MKIEESNIVFEFRDDNFTMKFDDDQFYRKYFNKMPYAKGVDFVSASSKSLLFLEVKNCMGHEHDCNWRISPNNKKVYSSNTSFSVGERDSLDIEMAEKVAMTIAAIVGAGSFGEHRTTAVSLQQLKKDIMSDGFATDRKEWLIVLFIEGDFESVTRNKKMIMKKLQDSIRVKLSWLKCKVSVVDSHTYNEKYFEIVA